MWWHMPLTPPSSLWSLGLAWSTQWVLTEPELHNETATQTSTHHLNTVPLCSESRSSPMLSNSCTHPCFEDTVSPAETVPHLHLLKSPCSWGQFKSHSVQSSLQMCTGTLFIHTQGGNRNGKGHKGRMFNLESYLLFQSPALLAPFWNIILRRRI